MRGKLTIRGWDAILHGWRWLHETQPIIGRKVGLGFPHRAERYPPGLNTALVGGLFELMCGRFRIQGWNPILPGCGGTPRTPSNQRSILSGCSFHAVQGGTDTWDHRFRPPFVGVVQVRKGS